MQWRQREYHHGIERLHADGHRAHDLDFDRL
jgi:hypothetical protein